MPAKKLIEKETIVLAAFDLLRSQGIESLNARSIAKVLNCSTQPIYHSFNSINELKAVLLQKADQTYQLYVKKEISCRDYPPYKANGMAYIRFAKEEKQLFKFLFMRERSQEQILNEKKYVTKVIQSLSTNSGLSLEAANQFHSQMWCLAHGIASMMVTSYCDYDMDTVSDMLTDCYRGLLLRYEEKGSHINIGKESGK